MHVFFLSLAEASPREALKILERTAGTWDESTLEGFTTGRREVVWALERIVFYPELFARAASLLLSLAEAENETWGNNASGVFKQLFTLAYGELAPTAANPSVRIPILVEAIGSKSKRRRALALEACKVLLERNPGPRMARSVPFGSEHVKPWRPKNRAELLDAITIVWKLVESKAKDLPDGDEREQAQTILIQQGLRLVDVDKLKIMILGTLEGLASLNERVKRTLTKSLLDAKRFHEDHLPDDVKDRLADLRERLSGSDFASRLKRYTGIVDWGASSVEAEVSNMTRILGELARQAVASPWLLISELPWATSTEAENSYPFGVELARADSERHFLPLLLDAYRSNRDNSFIGLFAGYLKHIHDSNVELWETTLDSMVSNLSLALLVPEATWRTGTTERAGTRIIELATQGVISPGHLRMWGFGAEIRKFSPSLLQRWLDFLLVHKESFARIIALDLFHRYYCDDNAPAPMPSELAKQLLLHPDFFESRQRGGMDEYYWSETAQRLISQEPSYGVHLLEGVLERWTSYESSFGVTPNRAASILYQVVKEHPSESWKAITRLIKDLKGARTWLIMHWLQGHDDVFEQPIFSAFQFLRFEEVSKWINKSKKTRSVFLARYVPKTLVPPVGNFTRDFISIYGHDQHVRNELRSNFGSEGFSGEASLHYQETMNRMVALINSESDKNIRKFLEEYIESLSYEIDYWRTHEERND